MNTLSYGLLSLLTRGSCSGYELMQHIQPFWQAKHSQIYPLLAMLEKEGLVQFQLVPQSDKPDKKVYSITSQGEAALQAWIIEPTDGPVSRDELILKTYCIQLVDAERADHLFKEREALYQEKLVYFEKRMSSLLQEHKQELDSLGIGSPHFGSYVLVQKAILQNQANLEWCKWIRELLRKGEK